MKLKSIFVALAVIVSAISAKADAIFQFDTFNETAGFGVTSYNSSPVNNAFLGQIWGSTSSSDPNSFVALTGALNFFSDGTITAGSSTIVTGASVGSTLFYQLRAWNSAAGSTFDQASAAGNGIAGKSGVASLTLVATTDIFNSQASNGFANFSLAAVPEPTTIALGVMGGMALLARRRRNAA